jgi:Flp pilus assembly protein TadB
VTIGAALAVIVVGIIIAALVNSTIGMIVAVIGVVGLVVAILTNERARR